MKYPQFTSLKLRSAFGVMLLSLWFSMSNLGSAATILHYWDMDTVDGTGVPQDIAGGVATTAAVPANLKIDQTYSTPYAGAGNSLRTVLGGSTHSTTPSTHLLADVHDGSGTTASDATAMNFGANDFSFSYWSYDDTDGDSNDGRPHIFDNLSGSSAGLQLGSTGAGLMNFRIDDGAGNNVTSNGAGYPATQGVDAWTHVSVNIDRTADTVEMFFNGTSQGTFDISGLTGDIFSTYDLRIGVRNEGNSNGAAQNSALDDLAFYSGLLTPQNISDLAAGAITPLQVVPEPSSLMLLMTGCFGLLVCLKRK